VDISGDLNEVNPTSEMDLADVTAFGAVGHTSYPGIAADKVTIQALYNDTEKAVFEGLRQLDPGYGMMIAYGQTLGDPAYAANEVMLISNVYKSVVTDVNRATINLDVDNYPFEPCTLLTAGKYTTGVASTGDGVAVNLNSASGTTGGAAYIQVFSVTGGTLTTRIETSSTGAYAGEEATTATFAAASTNGCQRVAISSQFYQYARASWIGATSTASFAIAINKK
jgi:hypothetical protein